MSKLIAISDGHELTTPGKRTPPILELDGRVIKENEFNKAVAILLDKELRRCGFRTMNVSNTANDSLANRVYRANQANADLFIAIHYNAYDGKFNSYDPEGLSAHYYPGSKDGLRLANCVLNHLKYGTKQKNRGAKPSNFYVLRETKMIALLTENGFMDNKREALLMINKEFQKEVAIEHAKGICDYYGVKYVSEKPAFVGTSIMGKSEVTAAQMCKFLLSKNRNPDLKIDPLTWCIMWIEEAAHEGVDAGPAFCQAMHETGYLNFGNLVLKEQNNYGGIGATNNSGVGKGAWFKSERLGIRASIQHLKAYGSKDALKHECVDPRFHLVKRGCAPCFENLSGKWAWPGYDYSKYNSIDSAWDAKDTYGHKITKKYEELKKVKVPEKEEVVDVDLEVIRKMLLEIIKILG